MKAATALDALGNTPIVDVSALAPASGCELWLDEHAAGADEAPALCRNKKMLEHLRRGY